MIVFYIIAHYLVVWLIMFSAVKLDNTCIRRSFRSGESENDGWNYIIYDIKSGHWWWLIIPFVNLCAAIVYLIRGLTSYFSTKEDKFDNILTFMFGGKDEY